MVKKSVKVLTVPETFNLNTDKRVKERSLSKNSRHDTLERSEGKTGSVGCFSNRNILKSKTRKNSIAENKNRLKII